VAPDNFTFDNTGNTGDTKKYEKNSNTSNTPTPGTGNKKNVYVYDTYTINSGDLARVLDQGSGSDVWCTRLPKKWSEVAKKICEEKGWSRSEFTRNALCALIQAYTSSGIDLSEVEVKPRNTVILNINNIENNVNVDRPPYKYARELEESRLKARLRALAEEILKGPPKEQKWNSYLHTHVEIPLTPEKLAKWLGSKTDQLSSILRRMEKLKIQLTPEEEELLEEVRKKLESMGE